MVPLAVLAGVSAGSESPPRPPGRRAASALDQARRDSAVALRRRHAVGFLRRVAAALTVVATQRAAHASHCPRPPRVANNRHVDDERNDQRQSQCNRPGATTTGGLRRDRFAARIAESASRLVATSSGYRAGLLASIAASCTASYTVALVPGGPSI